MAEGIVYLDVDDEITSAAQRIRSANGTKVALVVPYGSRIATSRMNFRLLSREALVSNKRLSIVSGDAGSRSLAASAGLPVFGSVGEYESSIAGPRQPAVGGDGGASDGAAATAAAALTGGAAAVAGAAMTGAAGTTAEASPLAASETVVLSEPLVDQPVPVRKSQRPRRPEPEPRGPTAAPAAVAAGAAAADRPGPWRPVDDRSPVTDDDDIDAHGTEAAGSSSLVGRRIRAPILAGLALVGLAAIVVAVGAYLFLPSASIRLTPRQEPIGPISISVAADPEAKAVDVTNEVVPAVRIDVPVEAKQTFTTTGTHVEVTRASGSVRFENYDPTAQNTVASGSIVTTEGGLRFRTVATVILPKAIIIPPTTITPSARSVGVEAVSNGPAGNVPANSIRNVPQGEDPVVLKVNNPNPTDGGTRTVSPRITKAEVDKAVAAVRVDVQKAFDAAIATGAGAPANTTLFAATATLGDVIVDGDPQGLVGDAAETFDIRATADGTVLAVDPRPVESIAAARLADEVGADHRLVEGSVDIVVGEGSVGEDGQITFEATARATRVVIVDAGPLRDLVKGRTASEARAALAPYGDAVVTLWPDWVSTITSVDSRLDVQVVAGADGADPKPSASTRASSPPTAPRASGRASGAPASGAASATTP
jgi:hypothetical protein